MKRKKKAQTSAVSPARAFAIKLAVSDETLSFKAPKPPAPAKLPALSSPASVSAPKPLAAPRSSVPPPADYRGKGEFGAPKWTPTRAPFMKTKAQLDQEQSLDPNNTTPRYGPVNSFFAGLKGVGAAGGAAALNLGGTVLGKPVAWAVDNVGGLAGKQPGWQEGLDDHLAVLQDWRDRGAHQFLHSTRSRALDDSLAANASQVAQHATPSMQNVYNTANTAGEVLPQAVGYGKAMRLAGRGVQALSSLPMIAESAPVVSMAARVPEPVKQLASYGLGVPLSSNVNPTALAAANFARMNGHAFARGFDGGNAQHNNPTNFRYLFPTEQAYSGLFDAARSVGDPVAAMQGATVSADNGQLVVTTPGGQARPFDQLSPDAADAALRNPQNIDALAQTITELPNNLKTPEERVFSGTPQDPLAKTEAPQPATFKLPDSAPPEAHAQVEAGTKQVQALPDEDKATAVAAVQNPAGPEAETLRQRGAQNALNEAASDPRTPPPSNPAQYGEWVNGVVGNFQKMDGMSQLAMGLGLGAGLLGLLGAFDEEGGVGGFLLAALGLGAAGLGAAGSGMLGNDAQQMVGSGMRSVANMFGAKMPERANLSPLLSKDVIADVNNQLGGDDWFSKIRAAAGAAMNPEEVKAKLKQVEQVKQLTSLPSFLALPLLRSLDPENIKTTEQAQQAYDNAMRIRRALDNPNSPLAKAVESGQGWFGG
jgi:hypothetical protein